MQYSFTAFGHENVTGKHKRTFEFTKDKELTLQGDCILGVKSNFSLYDLKELIKESDKLKMVITADDISDEVVFFGNPNFDDDEEIVVRIGEFSSDRTFGVRADKACSDLKKELIEKLNDPDTQIEIRIITLE
jgi:uncharacterized protein